MRSINEILKRNGIGEALGIKIKETKSFGENYKNNTKAKLYSISGEIKLLKNGINDVIRSNTSALGESKGIDTLDNTEMKSYTDYKKELGLVPSSEKFFGLGKDTVIKCLGRTRENARSIMKKQYGKPTIKGNVDSYMDGDIIIRYDKEDYVSGIDIFKGEVQNFSKKDKIIIGEPEDAFETRMDKLFGRTLLDKGSGVYYERLRDCTIKCKNGKVNSITFNYDRKKIEAEKEARAKEFNRRMNTLANMKYVLN